MPTDMSGIDSANRINTKQTGNVIDAVFADPSEQDVTMDDFLNLMVAQLRNQDFMNPVDDTQYMAQLAQFTTLQQMQEMAYNSKTTFLTSLIGKEIVGAKMTVSGELKKTEGRVDKVSFVDNEFLCYVGNESFTLDQIMQIVDKEPSKETEGESGDQEKGGNNGSDSV